MLIVGATALGAIAFALAAFCYLAATDSGTHGHNDLSGVALVVVFGAWGAALGAIVGLVAGVRWIRTRDSQRWKPRIWGGVTLGVAIGLAIHFASRRPNAPTVVNLFEYWPVAAVLIAALGMLGGMIAKFAGSRWDRYAGDKRRK